MNVYLVTATDRNYDGSDFNIVEAFHVLEEAEAYMAEVAVYRELFDTSMNRFHKDRQEWHSVNPVPEFPEHRPVFNKIFQADKEYNKQHNIAVQNWDKRRIVFIDSIFHEWEIRRDGYITERGNLIIAQVFEGSGLKYGDYKLYAGNYAIEEMEVNKWNPKTRIEAEAVKRF